MPKLTIENSRTILGVKAKMLTPEEVIEYTGHAIGGVCPFGVSDNIKNIVIYH